MDEALVMNTGKRTSWTLKCIHLQTGVQADRYERRQAINQKDTERAKWNE